MASERAYDISQWYDTKAAKLGWLGWLEIGGFGVGTKGRLGYSTGSNSWRRGLN